MGVGPGSSILEIAGQSVCRMAALFRRLPRLPRARALSTASVVRRDAAVKPFQYQDVFETQGDLEHPYRKISADHVSVQHVAGRKVGIPPRRRCAHEAHRNPSAPCACTDSRLRLRPFLSRLMAAQILSVEPEGLRLLAKTAMVDIAHLLRPGCAPRRRGSLRAGRLSHCAAGTFSS